MKKALSLILAVVLVFSMTTVAFAATHYPNVCKVCGATFDTAAEAAAHNEEICDRICQFCDTRCDSQEARDKHEKICYHGSQTCDYCGETFSPVYKYDDHIDACKAKYFNIPLAKILKAIENFIRTTDWNKIINTVIDVLNKVIGFVKPVITDLVGNISASAPSTEAVVA